MQNSLTHSVRLPPDYAVCSPFIRSGFFIREFSPRLLALHSQRSCAFAVCEMLC